MKAILSGIQNLEILKEVRFVCGEEYSAKCLEFYNAFHSFLFRHTANLTRNFIFTAFSCGFCG